MGDRLELAKAIQEYERVATAASRRGVLDYLQFVTIDSRPDPVPYRRIAEPWQWALARTLAPPLEQVSGVRRDYAGHRRFWLEFPRGHDKSSGVGRLCNWLLAFSPRRNVRIQVAAADRGQAGQLADFMAAELRLNPWLAARVRPHRLEIRSLVNDSVLEILAADAAGSFGSKPDVLVCDELTHWPKSDLWDALYSGMEKRQDSVVVVITNSGIKGTWQEDVLEMARAHPKSWLVYQAPGPLASWMSAEKVAELAAGLPAALARRVLYNRWVDPGEGCGLCTREEAGACVDSTLARALGRAPNSDLVYVASVDYGLVKDRTVLCVTHLDERDRVVVDRMDVWQGAKGNPVHADDVQLWMEQAYDAFRCDFVVDPAQLEPVIQRLYHLPVHRFEYRGGKTNYLAASHLLSLIRSRRVAWHPGCGEVLDRRGKPHGLADEMAEVVTRPTSYGWRIDHESGRHDDRVVALMMAAYRLGDVGRKVGVVQLGERWF